MTAPEDATNPTLTVTGGPCDGQSLAVPAGGPCSIGSAPECTLPLDLENVDLTHAQVVWDSRGLLLSDLGSSTGTYVNGEKIGADHPLQDGDRVFLGPPGSKQTAKLTVRIPATAAPMASFEEEPVVLDEGVPLIELMPAPPRPASPSVPPASGVHASGPSATQAAAPPPPTPAAPPAPRKPEYTSEMPSIAVDRPREAPAFPPPPPSATLRARKAAAPTRRLPEIPRAIWIGGGTALLVIGAFTAYRTLQAPPPVLSSIMPPLAEGGQTVTLSGLGFGADPAKVAVRFGDAPGQIVSVSDAQIAATIPETAVPPVGGGEVSVTVEARGGRSNALFFRVLAAPRITSLTPDVAMPGDEIVAKGKNLAGKPLGVMVAGQAAEVLDAQAASLRFRVPNIPVTPGQGALVVVQIGNESSRPATLLLGRPPLVTSVNPRRAAAGDRITIKGRGFDPSPAGNAVSFAGQPALVFSASETELTAAAPSLPSASSEVDAPIVVHARGRASNPGNFALLRASPGYFTPRYFPAPVAERPGRDEAFVSTDLGPLLLLGGRADAATTAERAARAATALNALVEAALSRPVALELREKPEPAVAMVGSAETLVKATAEDAAAYDDWDTSAKGRRSSPRAVATFWMALLQDQLSLFIRHERPVHVLELSPRGKALLEIYAEALRRAGPGGGVPIGVVSPLGASLASNLRDMALLLPAEGQAVSAAAMEGRWTGTMEESGVGEKGIQVRLRTEGKKLMGGLTTRSGGLGVELPLKDVSYDKGMLRFVLFVGDSPRHFRGAVQGDTVEGTIHLGENTKDAVGRFRLKYVD